MYVLYTRFFHLAFDVHLFIATYWKRTGNICLVWTRLSIWATHRAFGGGNCALIKGARLRRFGDHHRRAATNNHCTICAIAWTSRTHIDSVLMAAIDIIYIYWARTRICDRGESTRAPSGKIAYQCIYLYVYMASIFFRSQLKMVPMDIWIEYSQTTGMIYVWCAEPLYGLETYNRVMGSAFIFGQR